MKMRRPQSVFSFLALGLVIASSACGPEVKVPIPKDVGERWAETFCTVSFDCGCQHWYESQEACVASVASLQRGLDGLLVASYHASCFERAQERLIEACDADYETYVSSGRAGETCVLAQGDAGLGDPCGDFAGQVQRRWGLFEFSDCRAGLSCVDGRCEAELPQEVFVIEGEACDDPDRFVPPSATEPKRVCHEPPKDLYCSSRGVCETRAGLDEACDTAIACEGSNVYCHASGVCVEAGALAQACDPLDAHAGGLEWWARYIACAGTSRCSLDGRCVEVGPPLCDYRG